MKRLSLVELKANQKGKAIEIHSGVKAIALISGGLDSVLAAKIIEKQDIAVIPLHFKIPFCPQGKGIPYYFKEELRVTDLSHEFLEIIRHPHYGFGSNMNPCIDCKILMLSKARESMQDWNAKFIITGEVLGQRPMSQHKQALALIERKSGLQGLLLRPLSAKLLSETIPEKEGWVRREELLNFSGRTRKPQIELAKRLGINDYPCPAGGCLLTDPEFSRRIKDLINHDALNLNNVELLKVGRHFRFTPDAKLVVGRNERENERLLNLAQENDYLFMPLNTSGPTALGKGVFNEELIGFSCGITCRYCDLNGNISADITYRRIPEQKEKVLEASPIEENRLIGLRI